MSKSALKRGHTFNLTEQDLTAWWKNTPDTCYYCNLSISQYLKIRDYIIAYEGDDWNILRFKRFFIQNIHKKISDMTIDRKNNKLGYERSNIVKYC